LRTGCKVACKSYRLEKCTFDGKDMNQITVKVGAGEDLKENEWQSCEATVALSGMEIWLGLQIFTGVYAT